MSDLEDFVRLAREFSAWCRSPPGEESVEARDALGLLGRLYVGALALRCGEDSEDGLEGERADDATWEEVYQRAAALPFGYYSSVLTPHADPLEEPVVGDLADDVADIHRDLSEGLSLYAAGHPREAEWSFRFQFETHWGRHAADAIHALHAWVSSTGSWE